MTTPEAKVLTEALADAGDLVAELVMANFQALSYTHTQLLDSYRNQLADREAELAAIRYRIEELFSKDYAPSTAAVMRAVFSPQQWLIDQMRRAPEEKSA